MACETGQDPKGFAQQLADRLGVPVKAPDQLGWSDTLGNTFSASASGRDKWGNLIPTHPPDGTWFPSSPAPRRPEGTTMDFAHLFDGVSPSGDPLFAADHPRTDDPQERARLSQFLGGGHPVVRGTGRDLDWFDPERGRVAPIAVVTDGRWVWNVALEYYARAHGLLPESAFLNYIARCAYVARTPTAVAESARMIAGQGA